MVLNELYMQIRQISILHMFCGIRHEAILGNTIKFNPGAQYVYGYREPSLTPLTVFSMLRFL